MPVMQIEIIIARINCTYEKKVESPFKQKLGSQQDGLSPAYIITLLFLTLNVNGKPLVAKSLQSSYKCGIIGTYGG